MKSIQVRNHFGDYKMQQSPEELFGTPQCRPSAPDDSDQCRPSAPDGLPSAPDELPSAPEEPSALEDEPTENESLQCRICMDNRLRMVFVPCGHFVCFKCSKCSECPFCRKFIDQKVTIYF